MNRQFTAKEIHMHLLNTLNLTHKKDTQKAAFSHLSDGQIPKSDHLLFYWDCEETGVQNGVTLMEKCHYYQNYTAFTLLPDSCINL